MAFSSFLNLAQNKNTEEGVSMLLSYQYLQDWNMQQSFNEELGITVEYLSTELETL